MRGARELQTGEMSVAAVGAALESRKLAAELGDSPLLVPAAPARTARDPALEV